MPLLTKEPASNLELNVDQDKRESLNLLAKPAQLILDLLPMVNHASDAQLIKLFHHSVSAQPAHNSIKLTLLEMDATQFKYHVEEDKEESQ